LTELTVQLETAGELRRAVRDAVCSDRSIPALARPFADTGPARTTVGLRRVQPPILALALMMMPTITPKRPRAEPKIWAAGKRRWDTMPGWDTVPQWDTVPIGHGRARLR
jgi:hypothetical protein